MAFVIRFFSYCSVMIINDCLRAGTHLRCYPSHRFAAGPSPFTEPRAATPSGANLLC